jgi:uncharacterized membrane protein
MNLILKSFLRGLLFVVPVAATVWVVVALFLWLSSLIPLAQVLGWAGRGLNLLAVFVLITLVGFLAGNVVTGWILGLLDRMLQRMPLAKLVYSSIKDLMEAFVGERKRFNRPVLVSLGDMGGEVLGFITREDLAWLGRADSVAVYFPQSYNFAGNMVIFPKSRVKPVEGDSSGLMQFIVSGGVSGAK